MRLVDALREIIAKDSPAAGDVHVSNAGAGKKKKKRPGAMEFEQSTKVVKIDESLGLVIGWAIVSKQDGEDYFDLQGDHIPEAAMLSAAVDFMEHSRAAKAMHAGEPVGSVVFAFPMTTEIAKAFGIETATTGLMIAMKPSADVMAKFQSGEFTGFSIGGWRIEDEAVQ